MGLRSAELSKLPPEERERQLAELVHRAKAPRNGQAKDLEARIRAFEIRYEMTSKDMRERFARGEVADTADISEWLILLDARDRGR